MAVYGDRKFSSYQTDLVQIYTARITRCFVSLPTPPENGVINLNCLNFFSNNKLYHPAVGTIQLDEISPYVLRNDQNHIMENTYQFSKVYPVVQAQHEVKAGKVIWSYPAQTHVSNNEYTPDFWNWRQKGMTNAYPVRYPNGYHGRGKCTHSLLWDGTKWLQLSYVPARKTIYCPVYASLVVKTTAFAQLSKLLTDGYKLQICEIDVRPGAITRDTLQREINNDKQAFGHGYVLSACLLGMFDLWNIV